VEARAGRGVIRDPTVWRAALGKVASALNDTGAAIMGAMQSPLLGADGNVEFFLHASAHAPGAGTGVDLDAVVTGVKRATRDTTA
jgi:23S rRNA (cytidine1920-2'-O)/16S rRNA (cytidine1409-2'-O)-methyltransferase